MGYTAWSVVFGEVPSAAKWNQLGENDAGFKDGTNIDDGAITSTKLAEAFFRGRYQSNITNSAPTGLTVQFGWGFIEGDNSPTIEETVTFPAAFSAAPLVICSHLGTSASAPTAIGDLTGTASTGSAFGTGAGTVTTTNFVAEIKRSDSANMNSGSYYGYSWIAIGTV